MKRRLLSLFILLLCILTSCKQEGGKSMDSPKRSVYYWRTTFKLDDTELKFLKEHNIQKMYVRLFDVITEEDGAMPNRTITFKENVPKDIEIIPVVFFDVDIFNEQQADLSRKFVKRVEDIMSSHNIEWNELQVDFDWTERNQDKYFAFLEEVRNKLEGMDKGLSTTIRLHQLAMKAPPVDYGALMVYNIGNYSDQKEKNSVLTVENLLPYMRYLNKYPLPLATALPVYSWNLAFHGDEFMAIAHNVDLNDSTLYKYIGKEGKEEYLVVRYHIADNSAVTELDGLHLYPGDVIRHEVCSAELLKEVRSMISKERKNATEQVILYHLDNKNINKYRYEDIEDIFGNR